MNISTIAQLLSAATNVLFVVVIAIGYYMMIKLYRHMVKGYDQMLQVTEAQRTAMGRPQVIVDNDYGDLPQVDISVRNISEGAAMDTTFEFSAPVESSDGTVISDLAYFKDGLDFLAPGRHVTCYWDQLENLLPLLEEKGLERGILVTTRYKDLAGESYQTAWNLKPTIYRDGRYVQNKGIHDVARALENLVENAEELTRGLKHPVGDQEKHRSAADDGRREEP